MATQYKELFAVRTRKDNQGNPIQKDGKDVNDWTRLGVGFVNKDDSINLVFHFIPTDLKETTIQLRDPKPREERAQR